MGPKNLTFFCELEGSELSSLFSDQKVVDQLKELNAQISMGILDFTPERAAVVKQFNKTGIPVIAWLLLPKEQGYWFNVSNAPAAASRYGDFKKWSARNRLRWAGIGLDIEFDIRLAQQLTRSRSAGAKKIIANLFQKKQFENALVDYRALVTQIRCDGFYVESYQLPFIVDERQSGSDVLQRMAGLMDLAVDREVLMLYSSFLRQIGPGMLWSYGKDAQGIGVGSTGGGVELEGVIDVPPLSWEEFARDLLLARQLSDNIYIFSLEGCVSQNFLSHLLSFDWDQEIIVPREASLRIDRYREITRGFLWLASRPWLVLAGILALGWAFSRKKR